MDHVNRGQSQKPYVPLSDVELPDQIHGERIYSGSTRPLQNNPDINGIIDLDLAHASEDPATALLKLVADKAGCTVDELKTKNFMLEKGFRPEKGSNEPIPMYAYSNPPGPDCYYLVRHWSVTVDVKGEDGKITKEEMHFSKKIYTSVEVPQDLNGAVQKQQQYIAALAARTYAKIQESSMQKIGAGKEDDIYSQVSGHISKVAHDRFVTLEMFNNADNVFVNSSRKGEIKPQVVVDTVRFRFRAAKGGVEGESKNEGSFDLSIASKAFELKSKIYQFTPGESASVHVRNVCKLLNLDGVMENIEEGMEPKKAFNDVGLNIYEVRESKEGEKKATVESFYSQLAYFGDAEAVNSLMHNNDPNHYELSPDMLKKITHDERGFFEKFRNTQRPDLLALTNLEKVLKNPTENEMAEARKILDATKIVYEKMKKDHLAINKHENELALIDGVEVETKNRTKREEILNKMDTYLTDLNRLLPAVHNPLNVPTLNNPPNAFLGRAADTRSEAPSTTSTTSTTTTSKPTEAINQDQDVVRSAFKPVRVVNQPGAVEKNKVNNPIGAAKEPDRRYNEEDLDALIAEFETMEAERKSAEEAAKLDDQKKKKVDENSDGKVENKDEI